MSIESLIYFFSVLLFVGGGLYVLNRLVVWLKRRRGTQPTPVKMVLADLMLLYAITTVFLYGLQESGQLKTSRAGEIMITLLPVTGFLAILWSIRHASWSRFAKREERGQNKGVG